MSHALDIEIGCDAGAWTDALPAVEAIVRRAATAAWVSGNGEQGAEGAEISIMLTDNASITALNEKFRGKNGPTNVLSFPADDPGAPGRGRLLGDVVLAFETLRDEAREQGKTLADHASHMAVHGVLHLLGHDHETREDAAAMEGLEIRVLAGLGVADPYILAEAPAG